MRNYKNILTTYYYIKGNLGKSQKLAQQKSNRGQKVGQIRNTMKIRNGCEFSQHTAKIHSGYKFSQRQRNFAVAAKPSALYARSSSSL